MALGNLDLVGEGDLDRGSVQGDICVFVSRGGGEDAWRWQARGGPDKVFDGIPSVGSPLEGDRAICDEVIQFLLNDAVGELGEIGIGASQQAGKGIPPDKRFEDVLIVQKDNRGGYLYKDLRIYHGDGPLGDGCEETGLRPSSVGIRSDLDEVAAVYNMVDLVENLRLRGIV